MATAPWLVATCHGAPGGPPTSYVSKSSQSSRPAQGSTCPPAPAVPVLEVAAPPVPVVEEDPATPELLEVLAPPAPVAADPVVSSSLPHAAIDTTRAKARAARSPRACIASIVRRSSSHDPLIEPEPEPEPVPARNALSVSSAR